MEAKLLYKYGTIYREVLHTPVIDWCRFMSENDDPSQIIVKSPLALLYAVIRDSVPSIIHKCPYTVSSSYLFWTFNFVAKQNCFQDFIVRNCSVDTSSMLSVFPSGDYKLIGLFSTQSGESILSLNAIGSIISSNKDTFGWSSNFIVFANFIHGYL